MVDRQERRHGIAQHQFGGRSGARTRSPRSSRSRAAHPVRGGIVATVVPWLDAREMSGFRPRRARKGRRIFQVVDAEPAGRVRRALRAFLAPRGEPVAMSSLMATTSVNVPPVSIPTPGSSPSCSCAMGRSARCRPRVVGTMCRSTARAGRTSSTIADGQAGRAQEPGTSQESCSSTLEMRPTHQTPCLSTRPDERRRTHRRCQGILQAGALHDVRRMVGGETAATALTSCGTSLARDCPGRHRRITDIDIPRQAARHWRTAFADLLGAHRGPLRPPAR